MWRETIATHRGRGGAPVREPLARLVTGRWAFLTAGLLDLVAVLWWLIARRRSGHLY